MVFCSQASSVRQGSCRASSGSPKETILEAQVQEMAKKTQERLVADVNLFLLKIPKQHSMQNCLKFFRSDRLRLSIKRNWTTLCYCFLSVCYNKPYYSFKIFLRFWLAKIPRIIHQNQLLSTKFGRISPYWIDDVNRAVKLTDYRTVNQEDLGTSLSQVTWYFMGQINEKIYQHE